MRLRVSKFSLNRQNYGRSFSEALFTIKFQPRPKRGGHKQSTEKKLEMIIDIFSPQRHLINLFSKTRFRRSWKIWFLYINGQRNIKTNARNVPNIIHGVCGYKRGHRPKNACVKLIIPGSTSITSLRWRGPQASASFQRCSPRVIA